MKRLIGFLFSTVMFCCLFSYGANAVVITDGKKLVKACDKVSVVINIPAQRLRVYENKKCILDCRTAVGRDHYPGVGRNTKTRVGAYSISRWVQDYTNRQYPLKWSDNNWRGAFGKAAAMLSPRSAGQHIHGTIGPVELGDFYLERMPPRKKDSNESIQDYEKYVDSYEYGLSHGCTRLSNENIEKFKKLCPPGTEVRKIYCLHEEFETDNQWDVKDVYYPNIYRYQTVGDPVFYPATGELKGYVDPPDAIGYYSQ